MQVAIAGRGRDPGPWRRNALRAVWAASIALVVLASLASPELPRRTAAAAPAVLVADPTPRSGATTADERPRRQRRRHGMRVAVDPRLIRMEDGDTFVIRWERSSRERVRILGIDTPELRNVERGLLVDQPSGRAALDFARRAFAEAGGVEIMRAATLDSYGRTLAYAYLDGSNYSVMAIEAHLAEETISRFGDNGFPGEAAAVRAAAVRAGPPPFMSPSRWRRTR